MNNQLVKLYETYFERLVEPLTKHNLEMENMNKLSECATNPLLIKVADDYVTSKNKIMILGQDTNSWGYELGNNSFFSNEVQKTIDVYEAFYLNGGIKSYRGPFWNEFKRIVSEVKDKYDASFIYNNINKIGRIVKGNSDSINGIQFQYFNGIIKQEILITKPDVVVLFTGHDYDEFIKHQIGTFKRENVNENLWILKFEDELENLAVFNTFHPRALYGRSLNREVISAIIDEIKKVCK